MTPTIEVLEARDCPSGFTTPLQQVSLPNGHVIGLYDTGTSLDLRVFDAAGQQLRDVVLVQDAAMPISRWLAASPDGSLVTAGYQVGTQAFEAVSGQEFAEGLTPQMTQDLATLDMAWAEAWPNQVQPMLPPMQQAQQQEAPVQSGTAVRAVVVPVSLQPVTPGFITLSPNALWNDGNGQTWPFV